MKESALSNVTEVLSPQGRGLESDQEKPLLGGKFRALASATHCNYQVVPYFRGFSRFLGSMASFLAIFRFCATPGVMETLPVSVIEHTSFPWWSLFTALSQRGPVSDNDSFMHMRGCPGKHDSSAPT